MKPNKKNTSDNGQFCYFLHRTGVHGYSTWDNHFFVCNSRWELASGEVKSEVKLAIKDAFFDTFKNDQAEDSQKRQCFSRLQEFQKTAKLAC